MRDREDVSPTTSTNYQNKTNAIVVGVSSTKENVFRTTVIMIYLDDKLFKCPELIESVTKKCIRGDNYLFYALSVKHNFSKVILRNKM